MPDITVFGFPATSRDSPLPAPDPALTEIQRWEDEGGAFPPDVTPGTERSRIPLEKKDGEEVDSGEKNRASRSARLIRKASSGA
jgi:hypothetical protein